MTILQWTAGSLDNGGEKIRLSRPGDQELGQDRYWIRAEQVTYDDASPWPVEPDGAGGCPTAATHHGRVNIVWSSTYGTDVDPSTTLADGELRSG